jgi:hypothetical protein
MIEILNHLLNKSLTLEEMRGMGTTDLEANEVCRLISINTNCPKKDNI